VRLVPRQGYKVAPFKAQNMSNNARVVATPDGKWGEIGTAQYLQALAAGVVPDVRMNPLLLKPEADTRSQVVLLGQVDEALSQLPWRGRSLRVWPQIAQALDALRAENDVVVIEGAGSPAEINLHASDVVNMRVARHCARTACWCRTSTGAAPLPTSTAPGRCCLRRAGPHPRLCAQQVPRRCRLLAPAPQMLQDRTGVPTVACIPMQFQHGLPEEDGVFDDRGSAGPGRPCTPPSPSSPIRASATWMNSSPCCRCPACAWSGRAPGAAGRGRLGHPARQQGHGSRPGLDAQPGLDAAVVAHAAAASGCWASAAVCRCWARR
jgi:adenosylcobyric acid synthase